MSATQINRRKALTVVAAAPAAVACASIPAVAGEDAELIRLWEEWNTQTLCCRDAYQVEQDIEEKVSEEAGPIWTLGKLDLQCKNEYRALFLSSWYDEARKVAAGRRLGFGKAKRAL